MTISFNDDFKLWWPDGDQKAVNNFEYIKKNLKTIDFAISQCTQNRSAIQAGGHAGLWPLEIKKHFDQVWTFEPHPDLFSCLKKNIIDRREFDVLCFNSALGSKKGITKLHQSPSSGSHSVVTDHGLGSIDVKQVSIDDLLNTGGLGSCNAIFLDLEGAELEALKGAEYTIKKFRPVIQVEELNGYDDGVYSYLTNLGYKAVEEKQGKDRVYVRN